MKKYMKLAGDYKWDTETDENGNVKDVFIYTGPLYEIEETKEEHAVRRKRMVLLSILSVVFFIPPLFIKCVLAKKRSNAPKNALYTTSKVAPSGARPSAANRR